MSIYHRKNCPICNNSLNKRKRCGTLYFECDNNCYRYQRKFSNTIIYTIINIFDEHYIVRQWLNCWELFYKGIEYKTPEKVIRKEIRYWKENDRYIMKFLTNEPS